MAVRALPRSLGFIMSSKPLERRLLSRNIMFQLAYNLLRRFAVPFRRDRAVLPLPGHQSR